MAQGPQIVFCRKQKWKRNNNKPNLVTTCIFLYFLIWQCGRVTKPGFISSCTYNPPLRSCSCPVTTWQVMTVDLEDGIVPFWKQISKLNGTTCWSEQHKEGTTLEEQTGCQRPGLIQSSTAVRSQMDQLHWIFSIDNLKRSWNIIMVLVNKVYLSGLQPCTGGPSMRRVLLALQYAAFIQGYHPLESPSWSPPWWNPSRRLQS